MLTAILCILLVRCSSAPMQPSAQASDIDRLQGEWRGIAYEEKGAKSKPLPAITYAFEGTNLRYAIGKDVGFDATISLNVEADPRAIDVRIRKSDHRRDDSEVGKTFPGIYAFDGETLKLCVGVSSRPTSFDSRNAPDVITIVLERVKK